MRFIFQLNIVGLVVVCGVMTINFPTAVRPEVSKGLYSKALRYLRVNGGYTSNLGLRGEAVLSVCIGCIGVHGRAWACMGGSKKIHVHLRLSVAKKPALMDTFKHFCSKRLANKRLSLPLHPLQIPRYRPLRDAVNDAWRDQL
jgi:hypothetical protein